MKRRNARHRWVVSVGYGIAVLTLPVSSARADAVHFYHPDGLGTNVLVTDRSGQVVRRSALAPYGRIGSSVDGDGAAYIASADGPRHLFVGEEHDDESDLSHLNARYYDPAVGKFLSTDPDLIEMGASFEGMVRNPTYLNPTAYALNRPTTLIDPSGRSAHGPVPPLDLTSPRLQEQIQETLDNTTSVEAGLKIGVYGDAGPVREAFSFLRETEPGSDRIDQVAYESGFTVIRPVGGDAPNFAVSFQVNGTWVSVIQWNSERGTVNERGEVIPSALALAHEMQHALDRAEGESLLAQDAGPYDNAYEYGGVEFGQNPIAVSHGLPTRSSHEGFPISLPCPTCQ